MESNASAALALDRTTPKDATSMPRWKGSVWAPLVYPSSALLADHDSAHTNPYFPLQADVLRAAVRELLILDNTLDAKTLSLASTTAQFCNVAEQKRVVGPRYLVHVNPCRWEVSSPSGKRHFTGGSRAPNKKTRKETDETSFQDQNIISSPSCFVRVPCELAYSDVRHDCDKVQDAESLAEVIVKRACTVFDIAEPVLEVQTAVPDDDSRKENYPASTMTSPRKVSDADVDEETFLNHGEISAAGASKDISRFFDIRNRNTTGSMSILQKQLPSLLEVSIVSESIIRDQAFAMTRKLTQSFDDKTLRLFLGYKSSALKRERLEYILSEYLFDVSHAMFAWKQTELEVCTEQLGSNSLQETILEMLFDEKALRKIGGFDASSLLPHALSICRLCKGKVTWEQFAKTAAGQTLLRHHQDGYSLCVGQKRRGQRVRTRHVSCDISLEGGSRSRSSSIVSYDGTESTLDGRADETMASVQEENDQREMFCQMPDNMHVSLRKESGKSWGILLSKEGEMCVVVRVPETPSLNGNVGLKLGDEILSIKDARQDSASMGSSLVSSDVAPWFRFVVNLFKTSNELDLTVRRVGMARPSFQDDNSIGDEPAIKKRGTALTNAQCSK